MTEKLTTAFSAVRRASRSWVWIACLAASALAVLGQDLAPASRLIEAAGQVDVYSLARTNWHPATVGSVLLPGDRVRTRSRSRAAVQLSDRSVIRLDELTTLEVLPPRNSEKKRFGLPAGGVYFFNRERPADIEFDTPLAAGAIRGTEFVLEVASDTTVRLALIDGRVSLKSEDQTEISLKRGENLQWKPRSAPVVTPLLNATAKIQWALYYPAVVNPDELALTGDDRGELAVVLEKYRAGDLLGALAAWPEKTEISGAGARLLRAQLELAVGRVDDAEQRLAAFAGEPAAQALGELIAVVRNETVDLTQPALGASRGLARSYALQARADLVGARAAAGQAAAAAPDLGFAHARLAELDHALGQRKDALAELELALVLAPRLAPAHALRGFVQLDRGDTRAALAAFEQARLIDAAFGPAWLGRGLCEMRNGRTTAAREAFQAAAALEPQRSLFRSYLGKAASELGDAAQAEKEFRLARELDPADPTPWLYSALHLWQENRLNAALRDLEAAYDRNDNRAAFRSRELLDGDRSVRSANLAGIYADAGLAEVSGRLAARSVSESPGNFSGHLLLAGSYQSLAEARGFDLRFETARQAELLTANLLAPPGAGNLSQVLSQSDRLRFFDQKPAGLSSLTRYGSGGDWTETATFFGTVKGFSYALDTVYQSLNGERLNNGSLNQDFVLTLKQQVTPEDGIFFQAGTYRSKSGDLAGLYDPASATAGLRVRENQQPDIYAGWHHEWSPGNHTLLLFARLDDRLTLHDPQSDQLFLVQAGGVIQGIQSPPLGPPFTNDLASHVTLYSAELQQMLEAGRHALVVGGRWQAGEVAARSALSRAVTGVVTAPAGEGDFMRNSLYGYYTWRASAALSLSAGVAYDHLEFPENGDFAPVSLRETSRERVSPKLGMLLAPWERGLLRASYTRSLGGLYGDNSIRLEPTQVGGFNQAFRSLIPESVGGLLPGANFDTANVGFDQSLADGTYFGLETGWLTSDGTRSVGVLTNATFLPIPDSPGSTRQALEFRERSVSAYAARLLGDCFSAGVRYRLTESELCGRFPDIAPGTPGLALLEQNNRAVLHQASFTLNFNHPGGFFSQWQTAWYRQSNGGYAPALPGDDFWQHNVMVGFRFPRRRAELRAGVLNLFDANYRLNPLNLHAELPRTRTFAASLRLNF